MSTPVNNKLVNFYAATLSTPVRQNCILTVKHKTAIMSIGVSWQVVSYTTKLTKIKKQTTYCNITPTNETDENRSGC